MASGCLELASLKLTLASVQRPGQRLWSSPSLSTAPTPPGLLPGLGSVFHRSNTVVKITLLFAVMVVAGSNTSTSVCFPSVLFLILYSDSERFPTHPVPRRCHAIVCRSPCRVCNFRCRNAVLLCGAAYPLFHRGFPSHTTPNAVYIFPTFSMFCSVNFWRAVSCGKVMGGVVNG